MTVAAILAAENELTHLLGAQQAVVLSTRIRLARNLDGMPFPGWAKVAQRKEIGDRCVAALEALPKFRRGHVLLMSELGDRDRSVLVERHLVSKELAAGKSGAAVISRDQTCSVMVNEEDHLRIQVVKAGWHLRGTWHIAEQLDDALGAVLKLAFSDRLGYLTACPTNVGTGLRASAMVHLPGLCLAGHMEKVTRALSQDGLAVRGWLGEGTEAAGNVFQISNQQTLGEVRRPAGPFAGRPALGAPADERGGHEHAVASPAGLRPRLPPGGAPAPHRPPDDRRAARARAGPRRAGARQRRP
jgi:protein arginine kinase